jgi:Flp pilus assembly pilin Flp
VTGITRPAEILASGAGGRLRFSRREPTIGMMIDVFLADESGQGLVEYALIIALVAVVAVAALNTLHGKSTNSLVNSSNMLS